MTVRTAPYASCTSGLMRPVWVSSDRSHFTLSTHERQDLGQPRSLRGVGGIHRDAFVNVYPLRCVCSERIRQGRKVNRSGPTLRSGLPFLVGAAFEALRSDTNLDGTSVAPRLLSCSAAEIQAGERVRLNGRCRSTAIVTDFR